MKNMAELFTSIHWWKLQPNNDLVTMPMPQSTSLEAKLTHIVYTRDNTGRTTLYIDGTEKAARTIKGNLSNWENLHRFALANELTGNRPWLGEFHYVAIYSRALSRWEVMENFKSRTEKEPAETLIFYNFLEGKGDTVNDISESGKPLNLKIDNMEAVEWISGGGLLVKSPVLISSVNSATKIISACKKENSITIEAWIKPANTTQDGPARIVSISQNANNRNFTLGQNGKIYDVRFRTTSTTANGLPSLSPGDDEAVRHLSASCSENGDLAVIYVPVGGEFTVELSVLNKRCKGEWFNPRTGKKTPAKKLQSNVYRTPDDQDWLLLFQSDK